MKNGACLYSSIPKIRLFSPKLWNKFVSLLGKFFKFATLIASSFLAYRLFHMQLDGLLSAGAAISVACFAFTSLLYNRARFYDESAVRRRTTLAAELALRSTLLMLLGFVTGLVVFYILIISNYSPTVSVQSFEGFRLAPVLMGSLVTLILVSSLMWMYLAVKVVTHRHMGKISVWSIRKRPTKNLGRIS